MEMVDFSLMFTELIFIMKRVLIRNHLKKDQIESLIIFKKYIIWTKISY